VVSQLPSALASLPPGRIIKSFKVDQNKLGLRTEELCQLGIIVFTPGSTPSRDFIKKWSAKEMESKHRVWIIQTRVLRQSTFLIAFDSKESMQRILAATPIMLNSRMVLVQPFDPDIDISDLQYKNTAIWIDLMGMHPILEVEATSMLTEVGLVLHSTIQFDRSRFQNI
jgi:hypothetical protein